MRWVLFEKKNKSLSNCENLGDWNRFENLCLYLKNSDSKYVGRSIFAEAYHKGKDDCGRYRKFHFYICGNSYNLYWQPVDFNLKPIGKERRIY